MPPTSLRRSAGLLVLVLVALGGGLAHATPVSAGPAHVDRQAWAPTGAVGPASPRDDRLYVGATAGQEQSRAFVDLAVAELSVEQLAAGSLVVVEADGGVLPERAGLTACALVGELEAEGELQGRPPQVDCDVTVAASRGADGTWDIPLQVFASSLAAGRAAGVALLPGPAEATSPAFTVALDPTRTQVAIPLRSGQSAAPTPVTDGGSAPGAAAGSSALPADTVSGLPAFLPSSASAGGPVLGLEPPVQAPALAPAPFGTTTGAEHATVAAPASAQLAAAVVPAAGTATRSLLLVTLVVGVAALALLARRSIVVPAVGLPAGWALPSMTLSLAGRAPRRLVPWLIVPALVMLLPETAAYKIGIIAIVFIGAIGLHVLVNVAGELSLAHAAFVGLPAFAVAHASARADVSPVLAVPVGILAGVGIGLVVAATALRARGLQVALVTLAVAIGTVQFLFYREWIIGPPEGLAVPVPSVLGIELESSIARVPVLAALVALAAIAGTAIIHSKLGRGLSLLRTDPDVAAAAGIPVATYRAMAYAIAGGFAGLAGASYVIWVQLVSPQAFPLQLGFTYLLIAALAGRGGLGGVAVSALIVQGGALFTFLPRNITLFVAPVALLLQVTRFEGGINASLRTLPFLLANMKRKFGMRDESPAESSTAGSTGIRLPVALGLLMVIAGFTAISIAWYNTGRTNQLWIQNQEMVSGGLIGLGLIIFGSTLLLRDAFLHGSATVRERVYVEQRVLVDPSRISSQQYFPRDEPLHELEAGQATEAQTPPKVRARPALARKER